MFFVSRFITDMNEMDTFDMFDEKNIFLNNHRSKFNYNQTLI